jgi:hypothetical protein
MDEENKVIMLEKYIKLLLNNDAFNFKVNDENKPIILEELTNKIKDIKIKIENLNEILYNYNLKLISNKDDIYDLENQNTNIIPLQINELNNKYIIIETEQIDSYNLKQFNDNFKNINLINNFKQFKQYNEHYIKFKLYYKIISENIFKNKLNKKIIEDKLIELYKFYYNYGSIETLNKEKNELTPRVNYIISTYYRSDVTNWNQCRQSHSTAMGRQEQKKHITEHKKLNDSLLIIEPKLNSINEKLLNC